MSDVPGRDRPDATGGGRVEGSHGSTPEASPGTGRGDIGNPGEGSEGTEASRPLGRAKVMEALMEIVDRTGEHLVRGSPEVARSWGDYSEICRAKQAGLNKIQPQREARAKGFKVISDSPGELPPQEMKKIVAQEEMARNIAKFARKKAENYEVASEIFERLHRIHPDAGMTYEQFADVIRKLRADYSRDEPLPDWFDQAIRGD